MLLPSAKTGYQKRSHPRGNLSYPLPPHVRGVAGPNLCNIPTLSLGIGDHSISDHVGIGE